MYLNTGFNTGGEFQWQAHPELHPRYILVVLLLYTSCRFCLKTNFAVKTFSIRVWLKNTIIFSIILCRFYVLLFFFVVSIVSVALIYLTFFFSHWDVWIQASHDSQNVRCCRNMLWWTISSMTVVCHRGRGSASWKWCVTNSIFILFGGFFAFWLL